MTLLTSVDEADDCGNRDQAREGAHGIELGAEKINRLVSQKGRRLEQSTCKQEGTNYRQTKVEYESVLETRECGEDMSTKPSYATEKADYATTNGEVA